MIKNQVFKEVLSVVCAIFLYTISYAQTISGEVLNEHNEPIAGATVRLLNSNKATSTNDNGLFTIAAQQGDTLVFSFMGYENVTQVVTGGTMQVKMTINASNVLSDVVVVGYGVQKKVNLIGSVATIDAKAIENRPVSTLSSALSGTSSGVSVRQTSGQPGSDGATIRIRGTGTLNNNDALVIIDGVQGTMDAVNPNDVESISVLKDAAASAIYGSLAANGVILITTKKGTTDKITVSYTGLASVAKPANMPRFVSDYITHMKLINEGYNNLGQTPVYTQTTMDLWAAANANPNGLTDQGIPNSVAYPNTDWGKEIFENNIVQRHNVSLNGGINKTQFLLSAGYLDNPGTMVNTGSNKYDFRVNLQSRVAKFLTVGTQTFGSLQNYGKASTANAFNYLSQTNPGLYPMYNGVYGFPSAAEENVQANNIFRYLNGTGGANDESRISTTVFGIVDITKGLQFETRFNYQNRAQEINTHSNTYELWDFASNVQRVGPVSPDQLTTRYEFNKNYFYSIDNVLRYTTTLAEKHDISALLGYNQYYYNYYDFNATKQGLIDESITTLGSATNLISAGGDEYDYAMRSYFGRINYAYNNRYLFEGVFRYDGSSRFASQRRWGLFPSFSAGWRISEEDFMQDVDFVTNLKLRGSWGKTGNNGTANYDYQAVYGTTNYSFNALAATGLISTKFANPDLQWETTTTTNVGLDGNLLHNKLNFEIDLYHKFTNGILYTPDIPLTVGTAAAATQNIAEVTNKGVELTLGYSGMVGTLNYAFSGNFAYNFNRITKYKGALQQGYIRDAEGNEVYTSNLGNVSNGTTTRILEDHEINEFYLYNVYKGNGGYFNADGTVDINGGPKGGMIRTPDDMAWLEAMIAAGYIFQPSGGVDKTKIWYGDLIYADRNGDGIYGNTYDQYFTNKSATPRYNYGFNLNLSYRNIDFSMLWAGSAGMWYYWNATGYNNPIVQLGYGVNHIVADDHYYYNDANPGDPANNINGHYPRLKNTTDAQNAITSDFYLYNASYLKLKNIQIGYTLPQHISQKAAMSRVRLYLSGENIFTITKYPGLDPEIGAGIGYPTMRQFALGLNITF